MMKKVLVAYTSNSGSTEEVAEAIAAQMRQGGQMVDVARVEAVHSLAGYDGVIVGAPMILGWHRSAAQFVRRYGAELAQRRVAYFCTLMRLTVNGSPTSQVFPVAVDPGLAQPPKNAGRLGIKERYASLTNYLRPLRSAAPAVRPTSVAFFGGKLELFRLKWWQMVFIMVVVQAQPGDQRNWDFIRAWARGLQEQWNSV